MKKIIFALTLVVFGFVSMAQTTTTTNTPKTPDPAKVAARQAIKTDMQTLKADALTLKADKKAGNTTAIAADKAKIAADRAALKTAVQNAKALGIKKPLKPYAKQIAKRRQALKAKGK
jgi:hypothetical protein